MWILTLEVREAQCEDKWEKDQYRERIAKLGNGIAVIKVGASSETEVKYLKLKIEDGVNEAKHALEEGIVPGGNVAFLNALKGKDEPKLLTEEERLGYRLVQKSVEAPLRQIVENGNSAPDVVIDKIFKDESKTIGYNSLTDAIEDMYEAGIVDAVKVTKTVLQNAVSAAAMFLSIDTIIAQEPEKENE